MPLRAHSRRRRSPLMALITMACGLGLLLFTLGTGLGADSDSAAAISVDGTIGPVTAEFVGREISRAEESGAEVLVIRLNTPGGLVTSMREIVTDLRASSLTIVVWVAPEGARAGSAGAFIAAGADHVAMAPATNIGSATPISSGGQDLDRKIVNDSAAFIESVANASGHDGETYRRMVSEGLNLTAEQAVAQGVSDGTLASKGELSAWLEGRAARGGGSLSAPDALKFREPSTFLKILEILSDPNLVFLLLILGVAGIGFEVVSPGALVPGVVGVIALVLALAGLTVLPFTWAGLALIVVGIALLGFEILVPGIGVLALGGIVALTLGGFFLVGGDDPGQAVSRPLAVAVAILLGAGFVVAGRKVLSARRNPVAIGGSEMIGARGEVASPVGAAYGQVHVNGEIWSARHAAGGVLESGEIEVVEVGEDLTLKVRGAPK